MDASFWNYEFGVQNCVDKTFEQAFVTYSVEDAYG